MFRPINIQLAGDLLGDCSKKKLPRLEKITFMIFNSGVHHMNSRELPPIEGIVVEPRDEAGNLIDNDRVWIWRAPDDQTKGHLDGYGKNTYAILKREPVNDPGGKKAAELLGQYKKWEAEQKGEDQ